MAMTNYGPLTDLVKYAGILISAAGAIGLTWRRRANWEPSEQDVPNGPGRVSGLLTAVVIGVIWTQYSEPGDKHVIALLAGALGAGCLLFLLVYGYLVAQLAFERIVSPKKNQTKLIRTIGGFSLATEAKRKLKGAGSIQKLFEGSAYDPDLVWSRHSRALAKQLFVLCFIGLNVCGSIALSCAALLFLIGRGTQ